jgi:hypothetical protein
MSFTKPYLLIFLLLAVISSCGQAKDETLKDERLRLGLEVAGEKLKTALTDSTQHNLVNTRRLFIPDSITAVQVAEPVLFKIYGKSNIASERPYETYLINHYWVIMGTLPKEWLGGTFLLILDAQDGRIIKLTHGR